ncbi:MAG: DUF5678 domain-containing protein [Pyrinomonadaceae bacterium]
MSIELLDSIKNEARKLSATEKAQLTDYLLRETEKANSKDLGLASETEDETRTLRMKWLKENREKYAGQYVALNGNRLVGVGRNIREAHEQARQNGINKPFLVRVSGENEILSGGW